MARLTPAPGSRRPGSPCVRLPRSLAAAGFVALAIGAAAPAPAQEGGAPTRIDRSAPAPGSSRQPTVRVEDLGPPGAGSSGTLTEAAGGLGADLWRGAALSEVVALMARLPAANRSRLLHDLQRRVLLTVALAPAGRAKTGFAAARLSALVRMGAIRDALALAARARQPAAGGARGSGPIVRAHFLAGNPAAACALAAAARGAATPFLEQARIACHVLGGNAERAEIALRLLHETGAPPPRPFERAVLAAAAGRAPPGLVPPYAVTLALLHRAGAGLKSAPLETLSTGALIALSANPKMDRALRIRALERAAARGAPVDRELAALYAGARAPAAEIADAAATRLRDFDSRARTRLYLAAAALRRPAQAPARLLVLAAWWRLAAAAARRGDSGAEALAARQTAPFLADIAPAAEHQDHAAHIARVWLATGRTGRALAWYRFLKAAPFRNPADLHRITAPALLAASVPPETVAEWAAFKRWTDRKNAGGQLADLRALLDGLGRRHEIPDPLRPERADGGTAGRGDGGARDAALLNAAAAGQRGLAVLRILVLVNGRSLQGLPRRQLRDAVFGLRAVGLEREARGLAVEAALARQL